MVLEPESTFQMLTDFREHGTNMSKTHRDA